MLRTEVAAAYRAERLVWAALAPHLKKGSGGPPKVPRILR